jgi:hypothetical protein
MAEISQRYWPRRWIATLALLLLSATPLQSQSRREVAHVKWSLMDLVLVPDSCGIWFLAAPNVRTSLWETAGSQIVQMVVDPVTLLQWAGSAQAVAREPEPGTIPDSILFRATPRLQGRTPGRFVALVRTLSGVPHKRRLQLIVADSASKTQWKAFASAKEVQQLLTRIEEVVARAPEPSTDSSIVAADHDSEFEPVVQLSVPSPRYPSQLRLNSQPGRVWTEYVVGTDGLVEEGSMRVLLADRWEFADAATSALARARFRPATRRGKVVRQRVFQAISFRVAK